MRLAHVAALLVGIGLSPGCSFLFVRPPPSDYRRAEDFECTSNQIAPALDSIFAATNLAAAGYVAIQDNVSNKGPAVVLGLSVAALWTISAASGFMYTNQCDKAKAEMTNDYVPRSQRRGLPVKGGDDASTGLPRVVSTPMAAPAGVGTSPPPAARPPTWTAPPGRAVGPDVASPPAAAPGPSVPQQQDTEDPLPRRRSR